MDPSNLLNIDYASASANFKALPYKITDVHLHLSGLTASQIFKRAAELYGIGSICSMTPFEEMEEVRRILPQTHFIAMPRYRRGDPLLSSGREMLELLPTLYAQGVRIIKFWSAPRRIDLARACGQGDVLRLDAPQILEVMQAAHKLGMIFMVHVADPDTWFATKYADASTYGTKLSHYQVLEDLLPRFDNPWIAAHLGGNPEDLDFLSNLLERHKHLYLDTSAAKWMVRELSKHPRREVMDFFSRWQGRILFGSDIVTSDDHLRPTPTHGSITSSIANKASSPQEAFNLYASRYWLYRTMFETDYNGPSPVADPDLAMTAPHLFSEMDAPKVQGLALPSDLLYSIYHATAKKLLGI